MDKYAVAEGPQPAKRACLPQGLEVGTQSSNSSGRVCFLYEIADIKLIYGPLNAASLVMYSVCMQQI